MWISKYTRHGAKIYLIIYKSFLTSYPTRCRFIRYLLSFSLCLANLLSFYASSRAHSGSRVFDFYAGKIQLVSIRSSKTSTLFVSSYCLSHVSVLDCSLYNAFVKCTRRIPADVVLKKKKLKLLM